MAPSQSNKKCSSPGFLVLGSLPGSAAHNLKYPVNTSSDVGEKGHSIQPIDVFMGRKKIVPL